jgi:mannose-6-phosphate isomerase-like protein (cupin superfamily)
MKTRRSFIQTAFLGLAAPALPANFLNFSSSSSAGVVIQPNEGDTYLVRDNTPLTIKISKQSHGIDSVSLCTEVIPVGGGIPVHKHLNEDEYFFFTQGSGVITVGDKEFKVTSGTSAFVPKNTWHSFKNTGAEPIVFTFGYPRGLKIFSGRLARLLVSPLRPNRRKRLNPSAANLAWYLKTNPPATAFNHNPSDC